MRGISVHRRLVLILRILSILFPDPCSPSPDSDYRFRAATS